MYNGVAVEYDSATGEEDNDCAERESIIFKEIHSFSQRSLDDRGAFLLDFCSEAFIWVGKKVLERDRLYVQQLAVQQMAVLHHQSKEMIERMTISIIESGYEPEIFKSSF